ncbi:MAG: DUF6503 family protein [Flavobacteriaceae bacterium]
MQKIIGILLLLIVFLACEEKATKKVDREELVKPSTEQITNYPQLMQDILDAHGGLELWKPMRSLVFEIPRSEFVEIHTTDLYSRKDRIDTPDYSMGFDGEDVWLLNEDKQYEGDPVFYHNLMFYFFAMPFVLADEGIVYSETEDLVFEDINYPGLRISYDAGVGTTPKDEYFIHFDQKTGRMAWLGYTVTYRTGEKSSVIKWIRYKNWQEVNGVYLPETIIWHKYEGRTIKAPKNSISFRNVELSNQLRPVEFYDKPAKAVVVKSQSPE